MSKHTVVLDHTLYDLYAIDNEGHSHPTLIYGRTLNDQYNSTSPKFLYHFKIQSTLAEKTGMTPLWALKAKANLQRRLFSSGRMSVVILGLESFHSDSERKEISADQFDISINLAQMRDDQRPAVSFAPSLGHSTKLQLKTSIAVGLPSDRLLHLPHLVEPEVHYELLSKRGLAQSGLPTPNSIIIDPQLTLDQLEDPIRLQKEICRIINKLDTYQTPFMVKLNQTFAGEGTVAVQDAADRLRVQNMLASQLQMMLQSHNKSNHNLYPSSIVLQEFIAGTTVGISMFITRMGVPIFIGCCEQKFDDEGHWKGGHISYTDQPALYKIHADILSKVAQFLSMKDYYGPAGIDVLTDESGEQYVVDLNPRITGPWNLCQLKGFFTQRGFTMASMVAEYYKCSRTSFEEVFRCEIEAGMLIITGWAYEESIRLSYGNITVGGRSLSHLTELLARVTEYSVSVGDIII